MDLESAEARFNERRRAISEQERAIAEEAYKKLAPKVVVGEIWELEIGRFKVVSAGNKYVKLKRL